MDLRIPGGIGSGFVLLYRWSDQLLQLRIEKGRISETYSTGERLLDRLNKKYVFHRICLSVERSVSIRKDG